MKTLKLTLLNQTNELRKKQVIKDINSFRLKNKNNWYQVELNYSGHTYKLKCFNTWVQLAYVYKSNNVVYNKPSSMDLKPNEFKSYLNDLILD